MARVIWAQQLLLIAAILTIGFQGAGPQVSVAKISPESTIVLPFELVAGKPATLAVLSTDGRIAAGVKLVLSNGEVVTTDESGRAHFLSPPDVGILIARIPGTETCAAADVVEQTDTAKLEVARMPAVAASKDRFAITGNGFQGDADRNRIDLGGNSAFVLAASPRELVILASPQTAAGTVELAVTIGAEQVSTQITLVDIFPDAIRNGVSPGKSGKFVLHVRGTIHPLDLDVQNMSPEIVRFKHGDHGYLRTRGGADNSARIEVKGERTGEFSYAVRLRPQPGIANVDVARDILQATEKLAKSEEKRRIEKILAKLRPRNVDIRGARKEFARIPTVNAANDFQAMIRAAGEALNGQ